MVAKRDEVKQARWSLIQQAFDQVCNTSGYCNFRSDTFYVIAKLGLHMKAKEEGLLDGEDWYNPECKDELLRKVKAFLIKYIK